jgi:hypothetical protein
MDGAKHNTDTLEALIYERSGKQACFLRRSIFERKCGAESNEDPGNSRM